MQNLGDNTGFLDSLADALATDLPHAWAAAGLTGTPPTRLLAAGHSAGADAAAYVVGRQPDAMFHPKAAPLKNGIPPDFASVNY